MKLDFFTLVNELKRGNKLAFSHLYRMHYAKIYAFLRTLLNDEFLAEEISQDVFFRLWVNRESLDSQVQSLEPYLFTLARNTVHNFHKRKAVEANYLKTLEETTANSVEDNIYYQELLILINSAIDAMPPQQQKIFRLSREQGLQNTEIAERLHISKRTVEKHISNSLQDLRKVITKNYIFLILL